MTERTIHFWEEGRLETGRITLPEERWFCISVNGRQIVRLAATPHALEALALGFLHYNGYIERMEEIAAFHLSADGGCADIWLTHEAIISEGPPLLTSGCGQGVVLDRLYRPAAPLQSGLRLDPGRLPAMLTAMMRGATLYRRGHGIHVSALFTVEGELLALAEDIGRHNTLDKLLGYRLREGMRSEGMLLLTTGRVSSEMVSKAARLGVPFVATLKTLSSLAVEMAEAWGITALGHIGGRRVRLYTHPQRILSADGATPEPAPTPADD